MLSSNCPSCGVPARPSSYRRRGVFMNPVELDIPVRRRTFWAMRQATRIIRLETAGRGFYDVTAALADFLRRARIDEGLLTVFCRHTSASLLIQENADPSVLDDLDTFFARIAPEGADYAHD